MSDTENTDKSKHKGKNIVKRFFNGFWKYVKKPSPTDWLMVFITATLAYYTYGLFGEATVQSKAALSAAAAAKSSAAAAESSAIFTRQGFETTERIAKIQTQPQIAIGNLRLTQFEANKEARVEFEIENSGPVVALRSYHTSVMFIGTLPAVDRFMKEVWPKPPTSLSTLSIHAPIMGWKTIPPQIMTASMINAISRGDSLMALYIRVGYTDNWGKNHEIYYRYTYAPMTNPPMFVDYIAPESR